MQADNSTGKFYFLSLHISIHSPSKSDFISISVLSLPLGGLGSGPKYKGRLLLKTARRTEKWSFLCKYFLPTFSSCHLLVRSSPVAAFSLPQTPKTTKFSSRSKSSPVFIECCSEPKKGHFVLLQLQLQFLFNKVPHILGYPEVLVNFGKM